MAEDDPRQRIVVLVVSDVTTRTERPDLAGVGYCDFSDVHDVLQKCGPPALVISALSGNDFDAVDLARLLHEADYRGVYYAVTAPVPAPHLVKTEVGNTAPGLLFDLLTPSDLELLKQTGLPPQPR